MTPTPPRAELLQQLAAIVGPAAVLADEASLAPCLQDWSATPPGAALCAVKPASTAEVAAVVALCARLGVPLVPQGGGTGMAGGAVPRRSGDEVVLKLSRMNRVLAIDKLNDTVTVEAGCILQQLKDAVEAAGRHFPLALGAQGSCEIGGNLATNAGGLNVLRYGNARAAVLGLEVVLPDGEVLNLLRGLRKDNTGYDLKQLFIGAEGTLGIITRAVLQLQPPLRCRATAWVGVARPADAVALLARLRSAVGERISSFELISHAALNLVLQHTPGRRAPLQPPCPWYVLTEWGDTLANVNLREAMENALGEALEAGEVQDAAIAETLAQAQQFWALREDITEAQRAAGRVVKHDIAVPVSSVPQLLQEAGDAVVRALPAARVVAFGHVGDGNLHYNVLQPPGASGEDFVRAMAPVSQRVYEIVARLGGSVSAEHGLGQMKAQQAFAYKSSTELRVMRALKQALDPQDLMNRGKLLPP
jgi:FAD/FMN-containing dehydrogenase